MVVFTVEFLTDTFRVYGCCCGRYRLEFAKLSNRTRNKLLKFTNNVLLERSHTIEHVGINDRVKGKEYLFLTVHTFVAQSSN